MSRSRIWSDRRQWIGNLLPLFIAAPVLLLYFGPGAFDLPLVWQILVLYVGVIWLAMNFFGLYQNREIRNELSAKFPSESLPPGDVYFVGIATTNHRSMIDPHADVGFLILQAHQWCYIGEMLKFDGTYKDITYIKFSPNAHSFVGLGGYLSLGIADNRLDFELRESSILMINFWRLRGLFAEFKTRRL